MRELQALKPCGFGGRSQDGRDRVHVSAAPEQTKTTAARDNRAAVV